MKKIIAILFAIIMWCNVCSAFNTPDPNRWILIEDTRSILCYLDRETATISIKPYGNSAQVWAIIYDKNNKLESRGFWEINLDTRQYRLLGGAIYDDNGNVLMPSDNSTSFAPIAPNTLMENIYKIMVELDKLQRGQG